MHATSCHVRARRARRCPTRVRVARVRVARVKRGGSRAPRAVCPLSTVDCAPLLLKAPALWPLRPRVPRIYVFRVMCGRRLHGADRGHSACVRVGGAAAGRVPRRPCGLPAAAPQVDRVVFRGRNNRQEGGAHHHISTTNRRVGGETSNMFTEFRHVSSGPRRAGTP